MRMSAAILAAVAAMSQHEFGSFLERPYIGKGYSGEPIAPEPPKDKSAELKKRQNKRARRAKRGY